MHPLLFSSKPCPVRLPRNTLLTIGRGVQGGSSLFCITLIGKGELLITIMSSLAQEESRSISENVTWGHRKRFADGKNLPMQRQVQEPLQDTASDRG